MAKKDPMKVFIFSGNTFWQVEKVMERGEKESFLFIYFYAN